MIFRICHQIVVHFYDNVHYLCQMMPMNIIQIVVNGYVTSSISGNCFIFSPLFVFIFFSLFKRFQSSKSGRIRLHTDIRILVFRKHDLDVATMNGGAPYELRSFVQMPSNPKYSKNIKTQQSINQSMRFNDRYFYLFNSSGLICLKSSHSREIINLFQFWIILLGNIFFVLSNYKAH